MYYDVFHCTIMTYYKFMRVSNMVIDSLEYMFTIKYVDGHEWKRVHLARNPDTFAEWLLDNIEHFDHEVESITYTQVDTSL